jgi:hypothetical protein
VLDKTEDRVQQSRTPVFNKGPNVRYATYDKAATTEIRSLNVYAAHDGGNEFLLEADPGSPFIGDNVQVSKQFGRLQVEFEAAGFGVLNSGTGGTPHPLFVRT